MQLVNFPKTESRVMPEKNIYTGINLCPTSSVVMSLLVFPIAPLLPSVLGNYMDPTAGSELPGFIPISLRLK